MSGYSALEHWLKTIRLANWREPSPMAMFSAYFDETGHSADTGPSARNYVGMAGFVAETDAWLEFDAAWSASLGKAGVNGPFHMRDFVASQGQFKGWNREESKALFGELMDAILATEGTPVGAIVRLSDFRSLTDQQQLNFKDPYFLSMQVCFHGGVEGLSAEDRVEFLFENQEEFGQSALDLLNRIGPEHDCVGSWGFGPKEHTPLQAADVLAWALGKDFQDIEVRQEADMRWELRQLLQLAGEGLPRIRLFDRLEMLREIKTAGFPDQTGVEELDQWDLRSAQARMLRWLRERGQCGS